MGFLACRLWHSFVSIYVIILEYTIQLKSCLLSLVFWYLTAESTILMFSNYLQIFLHEMLGVTRSPVVSRATREWFCREIPILFPSAKRSLPQKFTAELWVIRRCCEGWLGGFILPLRGAVVVFACSWEWDLSCHEARSGVWAKRNSDHLSPGSHW